MEKNILKDEVINVVCPMCGFVQSHITLGQKRKVCENKDCLTSSGCRSRFIITVGRQTHSNSTSGRSHKIKIGKTDQKILGQLNLHRQGMSIKDICSNIGIDRVHAYLRLQKMVCNKVIIKKGEYPAIYQLCIYPDMANLAFVKVICPFCLKIQEIHDMQYAFCCCNKRLQIKFHLYDSTKDYMLIRQNVNGYVSKWLALVDPYSFLSTPKELKQHAYNLCKNISIQGTCLICQTHTTLLGHHKDYSKPLELDILCKNCHSKVHTLFRMIGTEQYKPKLGP